MQIYYENNFVLLKIEPAMNQGILYPTCITTDSLSSNATCQHHIDITSPIEGECIFISIWEGLISLMALQVPRQQQFPTTLSATIIAMPRSRACYLQTRLRCVCRLPKNPIAR